MLLRKKLHLPVLLVTHTLIKVVKEQRVFRQDRMHVFVLLPKWRCRYIAAQQSLKWGSARSNLASYEVDTADSVVVREGFLRTGN